MDNKFNFLLIYLFSGSLLFAQFSLSARDSIRKISIKDHQLMMKKLGIDKLREGTSGNP